MVHETQSNRWASRKTLVRRIQSEPILRSNPKPWLHLWDRAEFCFTCKLDLRPSQSMFRCFSCNGLVHFGCLMENSLAQKIPVCQVCASGSEELREEQSLAPAPVENLEPDGDDERPEQERVSIELRDPYLNPLEEIVLEIGSLPCAIHGYDHLSRDPTCEFCKKALGPLYRHLSKKYGQSLSDQTPTLSFDFSGPHPIAVTGARFMLLFVWRLGTVRLVWAFAVPGKTKECVRSCLSDVVAELNAYTGGSKPPVLRIHSDQAREF